MKRLKSLLEADMSDTAVETNDVPDDPLSYVEIKPKKGKTVKDKVEEGKKPEHNLGVGWMLDKDKELGQKVAQNKARSINRAMNATPRKPAGEYERKVTSYLKKKYNESIDFNALWEKAKPEVPPVEEEVIDPVASKKELDVMMQEAIDAHKQGLFEVSKELAHNYMVAAHKHYSSIDHKKDPASMAKKAKLEKGIKKAAAIRSPAPKPSPERKVDMSSPGAYYASKKPGEYTGD